MNKPQHSNWKSVASLVSAGLLAFGSSASAALVVTADHQDNGSNFTPSWTVPSPNLLAGASVVAIGNFEQEVDGGITVLTNGVIGTSGDTMGFALAGQGYTSQSASAGHQLFYTLPSTAYGYNITNITVFGGWGDGGRDGLFFNVSYATPANPTSFISCGYVAYNPYNGGSRSANRVILTDSLGAPIAANVAVLRFDFNVQGGNDNTYSGYSEIVVQGTPSASVMTPPIVITTDNQKNATVFTPTWPVESGSLIAGQSPSSSSGDFQKETSTGTSALTDGLLAPGSKIGFATCGNTGGNTLIYTLTQSPNGMDLTNIVVYSGWGNIDRDGQFYNIFYSTVTSPTTYVPLTSVQFNPADIVNGIMSANRVAITTSTGEPLARNVYNVKFDFTPQTMDNGYSGYEEIILQGSDSAPSTDVPTPYLIADTLPATAQTYVGDSITFVAGFSNSPACTYQWQVVKGAVTNDIPGATSETLTLNNLQVSDAGSYQLKAVNATNNTGVSYSTASPLTVTTLPTAVSGIITAASVQTGVGFLSSDSTFNPTWTAMGGNLVSQYSDFGNGEFGKEGCSVDPAILTDGAVGPLNLAPGNGASPTLCSMGPGEEPMLPMTFRQRHRDMTSPISSFTVAGAIAVVMHNSMRFCIPPCWLPILSCIWQPCRLILPFPKINSRPPAPC